LDDGIDDTFVSSVRQEASFALIFVDLTELFLS